MALTDAVPRGFDMETVNAPQHRPVHRRNFQTSPDRVGVDVGRKSDYLHQIEPTREQGRPCEPLFDSPLRNAVLAFQQLVDVTKGLDYLHRCDVIHGDLKGVSP